ncbi:unnamed protein product [Hydatigera taeniaeformis]|uniref:SCP domain-containing protein n=1 Tax=Hydatigena taeniaeformis TaxID=6205 RepID=A0A3P7FJ15_HYDTA|nr:unnamed protein product [Hydatigera taeniaeformis]
MESHLNAREHVFPPAKNMLFMKYSMTLERLAQSWASQCLFKAPDPSLCPLYSNVGYNIALASEYNPSLSEYVCQWLGEARFYNFSANTCSDVCSHYKQKLVPKRKIDITGTRSNATVWRVTYVVARTCANNSTVNDGSGALQICVHHVDVIVWTQKGTQTVRVRQIPTLVSHELKGCDTLEKSKAT